MINDVDIEVFKATMEAVKGDPEKGATVRTAKTKWKGGLKTEAKLRKGLKDLPGYRTVKATCT